ncbi:MAG: amidohydrolase family protein [Gemmatimonadaceae bacterium]|jgi:imidazolonepropionase-like amidohydrolase|nr:amidohydrolase family protein [Gemmatimonadaceae bacterium]
MTRSRQWACGALLASALSSPLCAQTIAITGGTVFPVSGPKIDNGTVVITNGRIVAVGASVSIPADAQRIDARGKWVTPGLFHAATGLGLGAGGAQLMRDDDETLHADNTAVGGTTDDRRRGDVNATFLVANGLDPKAIAIPIARGGGVTTAVAMPGGALVSGQAALIDLAGDRVQAMLARGSLAMVGVLGGGARDAGGGSRAGAVHRWLDLLRDARVYDAKKDDIEENDFRPLAASWDELAALVPVTKGVLPLYLEANRQSDIETALRLARQYGVKLVVRGANEGWRMARELAEAQVPVVVDVHENIPSFDGLEARSDNAALLKAAGVKVILAGGDPGGAYALRWQGGHAVRNGLSWDDALLAMTLEPARAFGVAADYGSLEAGKWGNVVVWSGDPLDFASKADVVLVRGAVQALESRWTELLAKYRTLPPKPF